MFEFLYYTKSFQLELNMSKVIFLSKLRAIIEEKKISYWTNSFEMFSKTDKMYIGEIQNESFKIKKIRRFFDFDLCLAESVCDFKELNNKIQINCQVSSLNNKVKYFYYVSLIYICLMMILIFSSIEKINLINFIIPLLIGISCIFFFSFIAKVFLVRSIDNLSYLLERDLFFLTKTN